MTTDASAGEKKTDRVKEEAHQLSEEARTKGREVGDQAREEIGHVLDEARAKAKDQAEDKTHRAADALRSLSDQLHSMAEGSGERGMLVDMTEDGADRIRRLADHIDESGFDGIVRDIESFARRRPGMYVAAGLGLGMVAGRLLRVTDMRRVKEAVAASPEGRELAADETGTGRYQPGAEPLSPTEIGGPQPVGSRPADRGGTSPEGGL